MFHDIPRAVQERMRELEALDAEQRRQGLPARERLCAIPPETGKFLALLAAAAPPGALLEVGTGGGYSALWLTRVCAARGCKLTTHELHEHKARLARETFRAANIESLVELVVGDAKQYLPRYAGVAFCFLDCLDEHLDCYEAVLPNLVRGGLLVADNVISHPQDCEAFVRHVLADKRVDALVVPIGKGELVCRKL